MNTALILAGGVGKRLGKDIPKQFLKVNGKPILAYTAQVFQNHDEIDRIVVVCVSGWGDEVENIKTTYGLDKIIRIIPGGDNSMQSISNGIFGIEDITSPGDIVIIHDSVRPLICKEIISDCIAVCKKHGNGCASIPVQETIVRTDDRISGNTHIDRSNVMRVQTPQAYQYGKALWAHKEALNRGITNAVYTNTLMLELGAELHFSLGSNKNIKITTLEDIDIFKALYSTKRDAWLRSKKETK